MSEPFGNKWKQYKIWPSILGQNGNTVNKLKLNTSNDKLILKSPNGSRWEVCVDDFGLLSTKPVID